MLDSFLRPRIDGPLASLARPLVRLGVSANHITWAGFLLGMVTGVLIAVEFYAAAIVFILVSRLCDGLDGAVARQTRLSDLGGFFDITLDFIFYAAIVFGFALARPENALPAAFLLFAFMGPAATFLAYAIVAAKRGVSTELRGRKSFYYLGGLTEGTETILTLCLMCVFPDQFAIIALIYGVMCFLTAGTRIAAAWSAFGDAPHG